MIDISFEQLLEKYSKKNVDYNPLKKQMLNLDKGENAKFNVANILPEISVDSFEFNKKIILIGEVQSGKTNNLIELVEVVLENNIYDHIIWMSGTNKNLAGQTFDRYTKENKDKLYSGNLFFYDSTEHNGTESSLINNLSKPEKKVISLVLKQSSHIKKYFNCLEKSDLLGKRLLLIDDECDYFSISLKDEKKNGQTIKKYLEDIIHNFKYSKSIYLGVTATPYSNFNYKKSGKLFADKAILLNSNHQAYTGLNWFNSNKDTIYIKTADTKKSENISDSLSKGLINLFYSYIIQKNISKVEMLVNIDLENEKQDITRIEIIRILDNWKQDLMFNKKKLIDNIYDYSKQLNYNLELKTIDEIIEVIRNFEDIFKIYILNSSEEDEFHKNTYESGVEDCIVIGGVMVSRGFTFENLTTEIMINGPQSKNRIDILLQRARWFGYRNNIKKIVRVIMNDKIYRAFEEAEIIQNNMINWFDKNWVIDNVSEMYEYLKDTSFSLKELELG